MFACAFYYLQDQGRCGCCWAVSLLGSLEGSVAIQNPGFLQSLSHQQLISCDKGNFACEGGNLVVGADFIAQESGGIVTLSDYPFSDYDGDATPECAAASHQRAVEALEPRLVLDFYDSLTFANRKQTLKRAVARQPVVVAMSTHCDVFLTYSKGILTDDGGCRCTEVACIGHAVLLVGFR